MRTLLLPLVAVCCLLAPVGRSPGSAKPQAKPEPTVLHRFALNPLHVNLGTIADVGADGRVEVKKLANPRFLLNRKAAGKTDLTEGRYVGFVGKDFVESTKDTRLVMVQVVEVKTGNNAVVRVSAAAAKQIKPGEDLLFFRPPGSTTAQLNAAPGYVRVETGEKTTVLGGKGSNSRFSLTTSKNNLKQLGIAMHNYHETFGQFPPAVVYGPDGKPWHSWRVLILPFIEESALYEQYRFDEPWNGPTNSKLLKSMPPLYHDPAHGPIDGNSYTHYAVISGKGTIFPTDGPKMKNKMDNTFRDKGGGRLRDITDGASNTIMAGSVGPDRKIPWMKPEDVVFSNKFPKLGTKESFALPYSSGTRRFGVFLQADGRVVTLNDELDVKTLRHLLQRSDGNAIGEYGDGDRPYGRAAARPMQAVEILRTGDKITARLVAESKP